MGKLFTALKRALLLILLIFILYITTHQWLGRLTYEALFWARYIVEPILEPYYSGQTGMLDGPYRLIMWLLSLLIEVIVYTAFFYYLKMWCRERTSRIKANAA